MEIHLLNVKSSLQSVKVREMQYGQTTDSRQLFFKLQHLYCLQKEMWRIRKEMKEKEMEIKRLWKAFLTLYPYLLRNLRLVVCCVIFAEMFHMGPCLCEGQYYISFLLFQVS